MQMCPFCDKVYDESEYSHCPYCSGELDDDHRIKYYNLLTSERLYPYLADIEEQAQTMFSQLVKLLAEKENVSEKLKLDNPMLWVRKMNSIRNRAMEIVNSEVIFV